MKVERKTSVAVKRRWNVSVMEEHLGYSSGGSINKFLVSYLEVNWPPKRDKRVLERFCSYL